MSRSSERRDQQAETRSDQVGARLRQFRRAQPDSARAVRPRVGQDYAKYVDRMLSGLRMVRKLRIRKPRLLRAAGLRVLRTHTFAASTAR